MEQIPLVLEKRETLGKKVKALRRQGIVPVHLYGPGIESRSLQASAQELLKAITQAGRTTPLEVRVKRERKRNLAFVREVQWDPLRGDLLHIDLMQVELTHRMRAEVPIELVGEAPALKEYRANVVQLTFSIELEALPLEIPNRIEADLSALIDMDSVVRARELILPDGVDLLSDADDIVIRLEEIREEIPVVEEEDLEAVGEEGAEGTPAEGPEATEATSQEEND